MVAEKADGGRTTSAEFNFKRGNPAVYEIKVLSADGKKLTQYDIDPKTGSVKDTHNEVLEKLLTRMSPDNLRLTPTTLTHAVYVAQQQSGGRALNADVDRKGDHLEYTVETVKLDGTSHKVKIDGSNGKVISDDRRNERSVAHPAESVRRHCARQTQRCCRPDRRSRFRCCRRKSCACGMMTNSP